MAPTPLLLTNLPPAFFVKPGQSILKIFFLIVLVLRFISPVHSKLSLVSLCFDVYVCVHFFLILIYLIVNLKL